MDLHNTVPDFPTGRYSHVLPALEKAELTVKELLLLDALEIAKQTQVNVKDIRSLVADVLDALHKDLGVDRYRDDTEDSELLLRDESSDRGDTGINRTAQFASNQLCISTLDSVLDAALAGGIRTGYVTEIAGESGCGKTQLLLHLLLAVQLPPPHGLGKNALYVATESDLPTNRLSQLLADHPYFSHLPDDTRHPSLGNVRSITTVDLESQDHILHFQVPVAVERYDIGLVVIDSVTANYRAELSADNQDGLVVRARELKLLGHFLRNLAVKHNIAIVVANQVSDQFGILEDPLWTEEVDDVPGGESEDVLPESSQDVQISAPLQYDRVEDYHSSPNPGSQHHPSSPLFPEDGAPVDHTLSLDLPDLETMLSLEHQKPFFTGWGDPFSLLTAGPVAAPPDLKAPALGLVWTNQVACRIVLKVKQSPFSSHILSRNPQHEAENPEPDICSSSAPRPTITVPDSVSSDDGLSANGGEATGTENARTGDIIRGSEVDDTSTQPKNGVERRIDAENAEDTETHKIGETTVQSIPKGTDILSSLHNASPNRRIRVMEVVFSPWTSGSPHQNDSDEAWEDELEGGCGEENTPEYEHTAIDTVEFEILPSGIRSVSRS